MTLSSQDAGVRDFWITHPQASRRIGTAIGDQLCSDCVTNIWIPDGSKDLPTDRMSFRARLEASLNTVLAEKLDPAHHIEAVESKLFGIGSESFVLESHDFYLGYAAREQIALCLDAGHFHPTESIADEISAVLMFVPEWLLHVSRGVRWDSDHVVLLDDPTQTIMQELVRCDALPHTHIGLDFFDASINRIAAWAIGTRAAQKSLLLALLEAREKLRVSGAGGRFHRTFGPARVEQDYALVRRLGRVLAPSWWLREGLPGANAGQALAQPQPFQGEALLNAAPRWSPRRRPPGPSSWRAALRRFKNRSHHGFPTFSAPWSSLL